jgi:Zinc finger, ZZ type
MTRISEGTDSAPSEIRSLAIRNVASFGIAAFIPDFDVCRLSFYLKCCMFGCGVRTVHQQEIESNQLLHYGLAHRLPGHLQRFILQLALTDFSLDKVLNRSIFIDDGHSLLPVTLSNAFFAFETVCQNLAGGIQPPQIDSMHQSNPREAERSHAVVVSKVMVCTTGWIYVIYVQSLLSLHASFLNAPIVADAGLFPTASQTFHCDHCFGLQSPCTCEAGCAPTDLQNCQIVHRGIFCRDCKRSCYIEGTRYRCTVCHDYDLCESCYRQMNSEHDQTHAFERIPWSNAPPETLAARAVLLCPSEEKFCIEARIPIATAVPIEPATTLCYDGPIYTDAMPSSFG